MHKQQHREGINPYSSLNSNTEKRIQFLFMHQQQHREGINPYSSTNSSTEKRIKFLFIASTATQRRNTILTQA
jgi:hypothetical protein